MTTTTTTTSAPETAQTTTTTLDLAPKVLADALAIVKPATGSRSAIAALAGVRIYTRHGVAYMETTDMEVTARRRLDAIVSDEFDALVSHADLSRAAKLYAKRASVRLESGASGVRVTDGKRTITLPSLRMVDFPEFPIGMETPLLYTDRASDLAAVLERAARFASKDETRPILTGIAFNYAGETTRIWATDSYRLADLAAPGHSTHRPKPENARDAIVNVRARGLVMAAKMMRKLDEPVSISTVRTRGEYAIIRHVGMEWAIRTLDGQYPAFDQLVPDDAVHEVEVRMPTTALAGACELAVAFARKNAPMRLSVNGAVKVTGSTPDVADFEEVLDGASYTDMGSYMGANGHEFIVGLNPEYVADIAKVYVSDETIVRLITPLRPVLFIDGDDRYLQMPIKLHV